VDDVLPQGVPGILGIIMVPRLINVDFSNVRIVLSKVVVDVNNF
jgi:cell division GTPase FtsZ